MQEILKTSKAFLYHGATDISDFFLFVHNCILFHFITMYQKFEGAISHPIRVQVLLRTKNPDKEFL